MTDVAPPSTRARWAAYWSVQWSGSALDSWRHGVQLALAIVIAFAAHARTRFDAATASWMRTAAANARDAILATRTPSTGMSAENKDARAEASRKAVRELAVLTVGADREERLVGLLRRTPVAAPRVPRARLLARTASDVTALVRAVACAPTLASAFVPAFVPASTPPSFDDASRSRVAGAIVRALETSADAIEGRGLPELAALRDLSSTEAGIAWLAAPARLLLLQDLVQLRRLVVDEAHSKQEAS